MILKSSGSDLVFKLSYFEVLFPFLLKSMGILSLTSDARSREFRLDWTKRNYTRI